MKKITIFFLIMRTFKIHSPSILQICATVSLTVIAMLKTTSLQPVCFTTGSNIDSFFSQFWRLGIQQQTCQHDPFLVKALCLVCKQALSPSDLAWPSLGACAGRQNELSDVSPYKDTNSIGSGPNLMTSFNHIYFPRGLLSTYSHTAFGDKGFNI